MKTFGRDLPFFVALGALGLGCARPSAPVADHDAGRAMGDPPGASPSAEPSAADEEVRPIYPLSFTDGGVDPLADRLCRALHELPAERRAACCSSGAPASATSECVRNVSAALHLGGVSLRATEVERCVRAAERSLGGCDWISTLSPPSPAECQGIFHGTLVVGQACRSTLECGPRLHCAGAGPTDPGVCTPAGSEGAACSRSVDPLATYGRQDAIDATHPPCAGYCRMGRCQALVATGGACMSSVECGPGAQCVARACHPSPPTATVGETCGGERACGGALVCRGGTCAHAGAEGDECEMPWDCRGSCVRAPGEAKGTCASPCKG